MVGLGGRERDTCGFSQQEPYNNTYWLVALSLSIENQVKTLNSISSMHENVLALKPKLAMGFLEMPWQELSFL